MFISGSMLIFAISTLPLSSIWIPVAISVIVTICLGISLSYSREKQEKIKVSKLVQDIIIKHLDTQDFPIHNGLCPICGKEHDWNEHKAIIT
jgi:hypothetical protein